MIFGLKRDHAYMTTVVSTVLLGSLVRKIRNVAVKQFTTSLLGFTAVVVFCGAESLYSLVSVFVGTCMIKLGKRCHPRAVFVFSFLFRFFFCAADYFGFPRDENNLANGVQLILTIKLISVAYEVRAYQICKEHNNGVGKVSLDSSSTVSSRHATLSLVKEPSFYDIVCYMYCFVGIATGPFFRFRTYYDMIHMPHSIASSLPVGKILAENLFSICFTLVVSVFGGKFFNTDELISDEFYEDRSFFYRFMYIIPFTIVNMSRYCLIWFLSECGFCSAGLGVYPSSHVPEPGRGPSVFTGNKINWDVDKNSLSSNPEYSCECIKNISFVIAMSAETYSVLFRYWNQTVQWWMAHFIYASKIFPRNNILLRWLAVSLLSAMWHGFKAGYYFSFLGMPFIAFAEHLSLNQIRGRLGKNGLAIYDTLHSIVFQAFGLSTFAVSFKLLNYNHILRYLKSVYFGCFSVAAFIAVACLMLQLIFPIKEAKSVNTKEKTN